MLPLPTALQTIQSCWQVPYITHFCSLFNKYLDIPTFDAEDLEKALLEDSDKVNLVPELITRLLRKCDASKAVAQSIGTNTFQPFLKLIIADVCALERRPNPYDDIVGINGLSGGGGSSSDKQQEEHDEFDDYPVAVKLEILHILCQLRFDSQDFQSVIEDTNPDSLRVIPLGYDADAAAYYYFSGTRLYKESNLFKKKGLPKTNWEGITTTAAKTAKSSKGSAAKVQPAAASPDKETTTNGTTSNGTTAAAAHSNGIPIAATNPEAVKWELVCETEADWIEVTESLKKQKQTRANVNLIAVLEQNFLPNISALFKKKQREESFNINKYVSARSSPRIKVLVEVRTRTVKKNDYLKFLAPKLPSTRFPYHIKNHCIVRRDRHSTGSITVALREQTRQHLDREFRATRRAVHN